MPPPRIAPPTAPGPAGVPRPAQAPAPSPDGSPAGIAQHLGEEIAYVDEEIAGVDPSERRRVALLHIEAARLLEASGAPAPKVEARVRAAVDACPDLATAHRAIRRFARRRRQWEEVVASIDAELKVTPEPAARAALHVERGRVLRDGLRRPEAASDFEAALRLAPGDPSATEGLRTLLAAAGSWADLAGVLESAAAASPDARAAEMRREAAVLRDHALDQPEQALGLYEMALRAEPGDALAAAGAERAYARAGRWSDLFSMLVRRAEASADPSIRFVVWLQAGTLAAERLGDAARAAGCLEEAARVRPDDPAPLDAMAEAYRRAGEWEACEAALARRAALGGSLAERTAVALRRADLLADRLSRRADAVTVLQRAIEEDPADPVLGQALAALLAREGRVAERVAVEMLAAERLTDRNERAAALCRLGAACEGVPGAVEQAAAAYSRALEAAPAHRGAFEALGRLHERSGAWKPLAALLEARIRVTSDDAERRALLRRLAAVREDRLGDADGAVAALEHLRVADPSDISALRDLQRLHAAAGRWREHAAALRAEADPCGDAALRADLLWRAGVVAEERLADEPGARGMYEAAVQAVPSHRPSLDALARLAEKRGRWGDWLDLSARAIDGLPAGEQAARLVRMASVAAEKLGDEAGAIARCRLALDKAPGHPAALDALVRLHERRREWRELAEAVEASAAVRKEPARRAAARATLDDVLAERLDAPVEAAAAYRRALADAPWMPQALAGLERVLLRTGDWPALHDLWKAAADAAEGPAGRVPWLEKLGAVLAWRLGRSKDAIAALEQAEALGAANRSAIRSAFLLHVREKQWPRAADALARLAAGAAGAATAAYLKEEASIRETHMHQDASSRLAAALEAMPADREAIGLCEQAVGDGGGPAGLLAYRLSVTADPVERAMLRLRISADVEDASDLTSLFDMLDLGARECPTFLPVVRAARKAAEARGDWGRAVDLLEAEGTPEVTASARHRIEALRCAAAIAAERLGDAQRARAALARAFDLAPADPSLASDLAVAVRRAADWPALARVLERHAAALQPERRAEALLEMADVQRDKLESPIDAARTLEVLLAGSPRHAAAWSALGEIRAASGSWQQALDAFRCAEEAIGRANAPAWRAARLRRVDILADRLGMADQAEALVREALGPDGVDVELLDRLARVLKRAQDRPGLEAVLERLVRIEPPSASAERWIDLARLARWRGDVAAAIERFARAAAASLDAPSVVPLLREYALREVPAGEAIQVLKDVAFRAPPSASVAAAMLRLLVARLMASQGRMVEAEGEVRAAVEALPDDVEARLLLAQVSGDSDEVRDSLLAALRLDPFRPEILAGLVKGLGRDARTAEMRSCAAQVLVAFGQADGETLALAGQLRAPSGEKRLSREQILRWIVHPAEPRLALELLAAAGPKLGGMYPQPEFGAVEPIPRGTLAGQEVASVASLFGVERFEACFAQHPQVSVALVLDERPRVIVGPRASSAGAAALRFHLGRAFVLLATGGAIVSLLPPAEIRRLVEGLVGQQVPDYGDPAMVQRIGRALGWGARRGLVAQAREYASAGPFDLSGWQAAAALTANRGGLLACADFAAARIEVHALSGIPAPHPSSSDSWEASRLVPAMADLLRYAVGADYVAARAQ